MKQIKDIMLQNNFKHKFIEVSSPEKREKLKKNIK